MTSAKKPSGAIKQNYDKILVVVILVALLISAIVLVLKLQQGASNVNSKRGQLDAREPKAVLPLDTTELDALSERIANPYQLSKDANKVLVGELRVSSIPDGLPIPYDAEVCPFTGNTQPEVVTVDKRDTDGDGLPDIWEEEYGLNTYDSTDASLDGDGDGFSNMEEYLAKTDPNDSSVTPPPSAKLRLVRVKVIPFKLRFLGVSEFPDGLRFQLNLRNLEKTYFAKMDEEIEGYQVISYSKDGTEGPTLTLQKGDKNINLIQDRVEEREARLAIMVYLVDGSPYRANIGETISLQGRDYKVVDISNDRVVIRDEEAGSNIDIGRLSSIERARLSGNSRTGVTP